MRRIAAIGLLCFVGLGFLAVRLLSPYRPASLHPEQFTRGECTWYVYQRTQDFGWRVKFDQPYGRHGRAWWERVVNAAKTDTPTPGSIMVMDSWLGNPFGHVAFVERVTGPDRWVISHANWHLGSERERRAGVPVYEAEVERVPGGVRIAGVRHLFPVHGFLCPPPARLPVLSEATHERSHHQPAG